MDKGLPQLRISFEHHNGNIVCTSIWNNSKFSGDWHSDKFTIILAFGPQYVRREIERFTSMALERYENEMCKWVMPEVAELDETGFEAKETITEGEKVVPF